MAAKTYLKVKLTIYLFLVVSVISGTADFTYTQAAIGDTDNDGSADISASAGLFDTPVSYLVGYCPHENGTYGLATGDVDNDGLIDVVVANHYENNMGVFIQDKNGNLKQMERYSAGIGSRSAAVGDINNDGLNDIVIVNYRSNDISVFLQGEDGIIGEPVNYEAGYRPLRVAIGDVSDDDLSDVVVFEQAAGGLSHIHIFKQNNTGLLDPKISYEAGNNGHGLAVGDINNDGLNDIVASAGRSLYVFLQESDGGFERIEYPVYDYNPEDDDYDAEIENIAIGDVNNDNLNDIVTCSFDQMSIYYQNHEGGLSDPVGYASCRDAAIGDINNDKLNDIVSVKWGILNGSNIRVFLQQHNSQFHQTAYTFGVNIRNVEINDLNNDGLNDVAVVDDYTNELGVFLQLQPGRTYHVDADASGSNDGSSWADAYNYLQDALMMASAGDEIRVAEGTYKPDQFVLSKRLNLGRGESFQLKNGVAVKGGYAGFGEPDPDARDIELYETILSGDLNGDDRPNFNNYFDNSFHVVSAAGVDETAVLDGLTIRSGNADAYYGDPTFPRDGSGGGLLNEDGASPTIRQCSFLGNKSFNEGGAIYNESRAKPSLVGCVIRGNRSSSGGGMCSNDSRASLRDCTFENNWAAFNGGGIYNRDGSHSEILGCVFIGNQTDGDGGAVYNYRNTSATLVNCAFYGNRTEDRPFREGGAIHSTGAVLSMVNCVFSGNFSGYRGGALYVNAGEATLVNCTLSGNESVENGGGMSVYTWADLNITNCIFRHNVADGKMDQPAQLYLGTDNHTIKYCCIEGWTGDLGGVGNFDADPLFVDADGPDNVTGTSDDNLRLLWGSPCLDSGDNSAVASIETDIAGNPRIVDGTVDIGAYEGPFQGIILSSEFVTVPEAGSAEFQVRLAQQPQHTIQVTVQVYNGDPDIQIASGAALTFTADNYDQPQTVVVSANADADYFDGVANVRLTAPNLFPAAVTAQEQDDETVPTVIFVDAKVTGQNNTGTSWSDAFSDLQRALGVAEQYDEVAEIRVAAGVYRPDGANGRRKSTFQMLNNVAVKGGYAGVGANNPDERDIKAFETILSGDLNDDDGPDYENTFDNVYYVVTGSFVDQTAVIEGFTIAGGYNRARTSPYCYGAGMFLMKSAITAHNCTFRRNYAIRGGAVFIYDGKDDKDPTFAQCIFAENDAGSGGALATYESSCEFVDCLFENNQARSGGAVNNHHSEPVFTDCRFVTNSAEYSGGAVYGDGSGLHCTNCVFEGNRAGSNGGGICNDESSIGNLTNCLLVGNRAARAGGASYTIFGGSLMLNCTIVNNTAEEVCGGIYNEGDSFGEGNAVLTNCIIWGNSDPSGTGQSAQVMQGAELGRIVPNHCCIQGWTGNLGGVGNIGDNPTFVDAPKGDFHLPASSPCVDAGDPNYVAGPNETDLDGMPRVAGVRIDMGAYELSMLPIEVSMRLMPQAINPGSKGNWVKAHFVLPEGFTADDVDTSRPAEIEQFHITSESMEVSEKDGLVTVVAVFDRGEFCSIGPLDGQISIAGYLTSGQSFLGTDTIKIVKNKIKHLAIVASNWLSACSGPGWCDGADLDQDTFVNFVDVALLDGCCFEVVKD